MSSDALLVCEADLPHENAVTITLSKEPVTNARRPMDLVLNFNIANSSKRFSLLGNRCSNTLNAKQRPSKVDNIATCSGLMVQLYG